MPGSQEDTALNPGAHSIEWLKNVASTAHASQMMTPLRSLAYRHNNASRIFMRPPGLALQIVQIVKSGQPCHMEGATTHEGLDTGTKNSTVSTHHYTRPDQKSVSVASDIHSSPYR